MMLYCIVRVERVNPSSASHLYIRVQLVYLSFNQQQLKKTFSIEFEGFTEFLIQIVHCVCNVFQLFVHGSFIWVLGGIRLDK